jgi:CHAT domain-containing protein
VPPIRVETADEQCAVARDLAVSGDNIWLGTRATEAEIKRLSEAAELAKYRIIHFATHGGRGPGLLWSQLRRPVPPRGQLH